MNTRKVIDVNWKFCLAILTCNVIFMSSSYTMLIPFLHMDPYMALASRTLIGGHPFV